MVAGVLFITKIINLSRTTIDADNFMGLGEMIILAGLMWTANTIVKLRFSQTLNTKVEYVLGQNI